MVSDFSRPALGVVLFALSHLALANEPPVRTAGDALGPFHEQINPHPAPPPPPPRVDPAANTLAWLIHWNQVAIDASGLDHTPPARGENRQYGEHLGPGRASRAIAVVQIAVFDAMNAIDGKYQSYAGVLRPKGVVSMRAAIAQSAHDSLVGLWPSQKRIFDRELIRALRQLPFDTATMNGLRLGASSARLILQKRLDDGSNHKEPVMGTDYQPSDQPGYWRQDPISLVPIAMGASWGHVKPFVLKSAEQFRVPPPPAMTTAEYAEAYNEVFRLGGDGVTAPTERTREQTFIGIFWAYDGTPSLCAPPRLYNQIIQTIAKQKGTSALELGRLLALANVAMADAGVAIWESKYYYNLWRPITGVREADQGMGPSGLGDGNPATGAAPNWMPLGAPASNLTGPNFTPPFPSYPSGHAGFGGALFQVLRRFYGTDDVAFQFVSDEWNGVTRDNQGNVRPLRPRRFSSLSQAEIENGQSRIYLGIHWAFDASEGITQGQQVGDFVYDRLYLPAK